MSSAQAGPSVEDAVRTQIPLPGGAGTEKASFLSGLLADKYV